MNLDKQELGSSKYSNVRQVNINNFDKSFMMDQENPKPYPTNTNNYANRNTVPILPDNTDLSSIQRDPNRRPIQSRPKPCICQYFIRFCRSVGKGWLYPRQSYYKDPSLGNWCVPDTCGSICAVITWMLIFYALFVVFFVMLIPAPSYLFRWINGLGFLFFSSLAFLSHIKAMLSDPGAVILGNATPENIEHARMMNNNKTIYKCVKCDSIKPNRAHHCSVCRRCIVKMDHHCPWVNNCIGQKNQKYFVLFTFYICLISIYSIYISVHFFTMCVGSEWEECKDGFSPAASTIMIVFLLVEGVLFGLFTAIMCGEQLQSICSDRTGIESLKRECHSDKDRPKSKWNNLEGVFGYPRSWKWLCPLVEPTIIGAEASNGIHVEDGSGDHARGTWMDV